MITTDEIKAIVSHWARSLPYKVRLHLFGSLLKGNPNPSDIDISLEFLEISSEEERTLIWIDNHKNWENYLSDKFGMKADLQLCEKGQNIPIYLSEASLLLYDSTEEQALRTEKSK